MRRDLINSIETILNSNFNDTGESNMRTRQRIANEIGTAIADYVEGLTLTIPVGGIVVMGSPTSQSNVVPLVIANALAPVNLSDGGDGSGGGRPRR